MSIYSNKRFFYAIGSYEERHFEIQRNSSVLLFYRLIHSIKKHTCKCKYSQMNQWWKLLCLSLTDNCDSNINLSCTAWTGGNDRSTEGGYLWDHSNTLINFTNWLPEEPNGRDSENCIQLEKDGSWNDRTCDKPLSYICEKNY